MFNEFHRLSLQRFDKTTSSNINKNGSVHQSTKIDTVENK